MTLTVFLDTGPLGLLTNPKHPPETVSALEWAVRMMIAGRDIMGARPQSRNGHGRPKRTGCRCADRGASHQHRAAGFGIYNRNGDPFGAVAQSKVGGGF